MRSMKPPLGIIDTRVTMTDSPVDGLLSPSFASVLAFDDARHDTLALDNLDNDNSPDRSMSPKDQHASNDARPVRHREWGSPRRCPRLELDVALDKYHILDGPTETLNPQNTPASNSGGNSPSEGRRRRNAENLRTSSAPESQPLNFYFEDQQAGGLMYLSGDGEGRFKTPRRRFSASDERGSVSPTATSNDRHQNANVTPIKGFKDASSARFVRFTPPNSPPRRQTRSPQRPLPSVERKQDYITSYRLRKQAEKWKGANRSLEQRISPYRSPPKPSQLMARSLNRQPEIRFASLSKIPFRRDESPAKPAQNTMQHQTRDVVSGAVNDMRDVAKPQTHDLALLSLSLHRMRDPEPPIATCPLSSSLQIRMSSTVVPMSSQPQPSTEVKQTTRNGHPTGELLLCINLTVPVFILRIPFSMISATKRVLHSRLGILILELAGALWSLIIFLLISVISKLSGLEISYHTSSTHGNSN
ncbi:uncharacterized protein N7459_007831 [Penicillium hispanicum]|uniref:uncharacterized protein n=1 Tax=Penicillium hispanicum TaxID=1080232 RepID=UPI002540373B|nr:uncharacterized protein N7459_007831 [Penicillium hispanicum]KAJ5573404.1 hypothetical protein N7459_007831 [Penicillium hispanicum]